MKLNWIRKKKEKESTKTITTTTITTPATTAAETWKSTHFIHPFARIVKHIPFIYWNSVDERDTENDDVVQTNKRAGTSMSGIANRLCANVLYKHGTSYAAMNRTRNDAYIYFIHRNISSFERLWKTLNKLFLLFFIQYKMISLHANYLLRGWILINENIFTTILLSSCV